MYVYLTMNLSELAIETRNLNFSFRRGRFAVKELSLQVPYQSIFGFLGPNGAGKTTTINLLTGMLKSASDNIFIQGQSLKKSIPSIFQSIGTLIETPSLYLHLSGWNNLKVITILRELPDKRIDEVLEIVGLQKDSKRKAREYSLGMKQRLGIAMALLPDPSLLLLDEPANGLDPVGIIETRELLIRLNREHNKTIFVSSHLLSEVEKTCTHVGIIHKGVVRFQGSLQDLQQSAGEAREVIIKINEAKQWMSKIAELFPGAKAGRNNELNITFENASEVPFINNKLVEAGIPVSGLRVREGLEEWFIKMTQQ